jgi:ATP adenylyltransferase
MERLWAPWRMPFIKSAKKSKKQRHCVFCKAYRGPHDADNLVVTRGKKSIALMNIYPYNNGHMMIAPNRHTADLEHISGEVWQDMMALLTRCKHALDKTMKPHGFNIGINMGKSAGAGIAHHLHMHIVPRWNGDMNFMPVVASTKVIPQSLQEGYEMISRAMKVKR